MSIGCIGVETPKEGCTTERKKVTNMKKIEKIGLITFFIDFTSQILLKVFLKRIDMTRRAGWSHPTRRVIRCQG